MKRLINEKTLEIISLEELNIQDILNVVKLEDSNYIYNLYVKWRENGDKNHEVLAYPFDWDCSKKYVREEFSEYIELDFIIDYATMLVIENRYNMINYGTVSL